MYTVKDYSAGCNIKIRPATSLDAIEISDIYRYYVENTTISFETSPPDSDEICRRLESFINSGFPYIVAEVDGRIVGYAYAHRWKDRQAYIRTWETTIYLAHGMVGNGIGTKLMHTLIDMARNRGCHALIACITAENTFSCRFHERLGFQLVSKFRQVGYKYNRYLDVTDYELILDSVAEEIESKMVSMRNDVQAKHMMRFFKCGHGEYGEGDQFLGLRVPQTRAIVKEYSKTSDLCDARLLVNSPWHEVRLAGFLLMIEHYKQEKKKSTKRAGEIVECYLDSIGRANNWDLVDLSAPYILGDWLVTHPKERDILNTLSDKHGKLWHQRVAMVANWMLIRNNVYSYTFDIAEKYMNHPHDLIHKATGWMLREVGKRGGGKELREFLDCHAEKMPRTMLRYAIEKFPESERQYYLFR